MNEKVKGIKKYRDSLSLKYGKHLIDIHIYKSHIDDLLSLLSSESKEIEDLKSDLKLNASMLAKQTDLAREAETKVKEFESGIMEAIEDLRDLIK